MNIQTETASLGHNNPPATIRDRLRLDRKELFDRLEQLKDACSKAPGEIRDEENAKLASDLLKQVRKALSAAEEARKTEQEPWETKLAETRATFVVPMTQLKEARAPLKTAHDEFLQRKKDEAKRAAEAEARRQKEEAERQAKAAQEAERKRIEAEREAEKAKEAAREAQRQLEASQAEARQAKLDLAQAKEDEAKREAERRQKEADEKAERQRADRKREQETADRASAEAKQAGKAAGENFDEAIRNEQRAQRNESLAAGKPSKLSQVRSDYGAVSSLAARTVAEIVDFDKLPKGILWGYIHRDAIAVAVNKAVAAGRTERDLPGVRIVIVEEGRTV